MSTRRSIELWKQDLLERERSFERPRVTEEAGPWDWWDWSIAVVAVVVLVTLVVRW